jgi:hypothetical protein
MDRTSASLRTIIATAALAVLTAACGGNPASAGGSSSPGGPATPPSAVAYSACARSHGMPNFPDPPSGGGIAKASAQHPRGGELPRSRHRSPGTAVFDVSAHGISDGMAHSPSFTAKLDDCQRQTGNFPYSFG